jgi:preprotein translocase subunit SecG
MFGFLMALEVVVSILLIIVVLMQASKGGGLAGTFGGGNVGMMFGVRRTADFLIKATQWLAVIFGALALIINIFFLPRAGVDAESVLQRSAAQQQSVPAPNVPQLPPAQAPATPTQSAPGK